MAENGSDIEKARKSEQSKFDTERTQLNEQITDLQGQIETRDKDLTALNENLTNAKADAGKLKEAQTALKDLQSKYNTERKDWEEKTAKQQYAFAVKTASGNLRFSSAAAKRDFERGAIEKGLKMDGDKILGFDDYVKSYQEADPGAFVAEKTEEPTDPAKAPTIVLPKSQNPEPNKSAFNFNFTGVRPHASKGN